MSIAAVMWMTKQKAGDATAKALLFWLAWHLNDDTGLCCPSVSLLAQEMEVSSENTVRAALSRLKASGLIESTFDYSPSGSIKRTLYRLVGYERGSIIEGGSIIGSPSNIEGVPNIEGGANIDRPVPQNLRECPSKIEVPSLKNCTLNKKESKSIENLKEKSVAHSAQPLRTSFTFDTKKAEQADADSEPEPLTLTPTEPEKKKGGKKPKRLATEWYGLPDAVRDDWIAFRNDRKALLTQTAVNRMKAEADRAGIPFADFVAETMAAGWTGGKAGWVARRINDGENGKPLQTEAEKQREGEARVKFREYGHLLIECHRLDDSAKFADFVKDPERYIREAKQWIEEYKKNNGEQPPF